MNDDLTFNKNNPDVLLLLANLSSDEVFTPPKIVNLMLDMLPQNLFENPDAKFLDPASKSGVFLREIAKRLIKGLENKIPVLEERVNHILHEQLYGIGITELTAFISRRTLYCTMNPQSVFSVCKFDDNEGNIKFENCTHKFNKKGRCDFCGASKEKLERSEEEDTHAYEFIHVLKPERIFDMKFDVVISNPPYQMSDGGGNGASARPIYHKFVEQAIKLNPKYISMIIPSRWFTGGKGLDDFRDKMLHDERLKIIHDYLEAVDCFPGVQIKGGVCYFLWDRDYKGDCTIYTHRGETTTKPIKRSLIERTIDIFIRYNEAVSIIRKVREFHENSFARLVSARMPFGFPNTFKGYKEQKEDTDLIIYVSGNDKEIKGSMAFCPLKKVSRGHNMISWHKVYIAKAGSGSDNFPHPILTEPFYGAPNTICNESYLVIGPFENQDICKNVMSYIATKFFRFLVLLLKNTQNAPRAVYQFVPMQDFSKSWTDEELYKKYNLDENEISFIESMIRPMELGVRK